MDEHPGGDEVLTAEAGKDASEAFEDVGHSDDARSLLPSMLVGSIEGVVSWLGPLGPTPQFVVSPLFSPITLS